jgi:hypothetical protein
MESPAEEWRCMPGLPDVQVSSLGRVMRAGRIVPASQNKHIGYREVRVRGRHFYVHRMVLHAFRGPPPKNHEACHANGDRGDNRIVNLRWGTRSANRRDATRHGTAAGGGGPRLTAEAVAEIRASSSRSVELAARYGVSPSCISQARNRRTWKSLPPFS